VEGPSRRGVSGCSLPFMGILASLRRTVADAVSDAFGPRPLDLELVSSSASADLVYQTTRDGLRITVLRDYPEAPWSWTVEDASDNRLIAFRGNVASRQECERAVMAWLAGGDGKACQAGKREGFDVPPRAA
jgi:hypothetical protein